MLIKNAWCSILGSGGVFGMKNSKLKSSKNPLFTVFLNSEKLNKNEKFYEQNLNNRYLWFFNMAKQILHPSKK